jgi:hypothetical protein
MDMKRGVRITKPENAGKKHSGTLGIKFQLPQVLVYPFYFRNGVFYPLLSF